MFYNFNRHKEKYRIGSSSRQDDEGNSKSSIPGLINNSFRRLRVKWQRTLIWILVAAGAMYSAYLIGASFLGWPASVNLNFVLLRFSTPPGPDPSDRAQSHASYLDSLEAAYLKDSINQSQLQHHDADTNLLP